MVFSSLTFLFFFLPGTLVAYYALPRRSWRNALLLFVSLFFYAWGEPVYVLLFLVSIGVNWGLALAIARSASHRGWLLAGGVALNLLSIGVFKYTAFLLRNVNGVLGTGWPVPQIALPIGISFYTFQALSYLVDVYRGTVKAQRNPVFFGTYLAMFPQLIAGPIVRYETIAEELLGRRENLAEFSHGLERFCLGLGKKVLLANTLGSVADAILRAPPTVGAVPAWAAFVAYAFQIYFDFSGYSDMAIGLGRMFGFHFLENFNYPYTATSVTDFWRRWHISLSSFFRDYVYLPLGGNRVRAPRWVVNLLIVWGLTGLWHGASWNFGFWGCYYGVLLIGERLLWGGLLARLPTLVQHLYALVAVLLGWVFFRVEGFSASAHWIAALFGGYGLGNLATLNVLGVLHLWPWFLAAALASTPWPRALLRRLLTRWGQRGGRMEYWNDGTMSGGDVPAASIPAFQYSIIPFLRVSWTTFLFAWSSLALVVGGFNPFIYFRF